MIHLRDDFIRLLFVYFSKFVLKAYGLYYTQCLNFLEGNENFPSLIFVCGKQELYFLASLGQLQEVGEG